MILKNHSRRLRRPQSQNQNQSLSQYLNRNQSLSRNRHYLSLNRCQILCRDTGSPFCPNSSGSSLPDRQLSNDPTSPSHHIVLHMARMPHMTFLAPRRPRFLLALLLSASLLLGGCRLQLELPTPHPQPPAPTPGPVEPTPNPPPAPNPAPVGNVQQYEYYSALARAVLEGEFEDTDSLFAFSKYYREKRGFPEAGPVASREFADITSNRSLSTEAVRKDIAARLDRVADAKLRGE